MSYKCASHTKYSKVLVSTICVILWLGSSVSSAANTTKRFQALGEDHITKGRFLGVKRQPRFITFHTKEEEISVEMELKVPFLTIPVKKTINGATGFLGNLPSANINLGAVGVAGAAILGAVLIVPNFVELMFANHVSHKEERRSREARQSSLHQLGRALSEHGAPAEECAQRALCAMVRRSKGALEPSSIDKIVDGLVSNEWLMALLKGTFIAKAVSSSYGPGSCAANYPRCNLNPLALQRLTETIYKTIFSN